MAVAKQQTDQDLRRASPGVFENPVIGYQRLGRDQPVYYTLLVDRQPRSYRVVPERCSFPISRLERLKPPTLDPPSQSSSVVAGSCA